MYESIRLPEYLFVPEVYILPQLSYRLEKHNGIFKIALVKSSQIEAGELGGQ